MTKEQFESLSPEEQRAEIERCKNPLYFYNNYWKNVKQLTKEEWNIYSDSILSKRDEAINGRKANVPPLDCRKNPLTTTECFIIK